MAGRLCEWIDDWIDVKIKHSDLFLIILLLKLKEKRQFFPFNLTFLKQLTNLWKQPKWTVFYNYVPGID